MDKPNNKIELDESSAVHNLKNNSVVHVAEGKTSSKKYLEKLDAVDDKVAEDDIKDSPITTPKEEESPRSHGIEKGEQRTKDIIAADDETKVFATALHEEEERKSAEFYNATVEKNTKRTRRKRRRSKESRLSTSTSGTPRSDSRSLCSVL